MQTTPFGDPNPLPAGKRGRPLLLEAKDWVLDSGDSDDLVVALRRWMQDPVFAKPLGREAGDPGAGTITAFVLRFDRLLAHLFAIRERESRKPIGICQIHIDPANRNAWLDLVIGERGAQDSQFAPTEAGFAAVSWIFDTIGLEKLNVQVAESNGRTNAWLAKRFTLEARLREEIALADGTRETLLRYGMLKSEWAALKEWRRNRDATGGSPIVQRRPFENQAPDRS